MSLESEIAEEIMAVEPVVAEEPLCPLAYEPEEEDWEAAVEHFFGLAQSDPDLFANIQIVIPVRPAEGINPQLAQMLSCWSMAGINWAKLEDHFGGFIECTRARMVYEYTKTSAKQCLLMIDSDMKPPLHLPWMLARWGAPVVGSVAMSVNREHGPMLCFCTKCTDGKYRYPTLRSGLRIPARGLLDVGAVGTGAMLIRREVIESFDFEDPESESPFFIEERIRSQGFKTGTLLRGEDIQFCIQARQRGFKVAVDLEAIVGHRKTMTLFCEPQVRDPRIDVDSWRMHAEGMPSGVGEVDGE